jgi:hypothetical protein
MSHFTTIRTHLTNTHHLLQALADLGYPVQHGPVSVKGYGSIRTQVPFKISGAKRGEEIGFRPGSGGYELVADWWGIRSLNRDDFVRQLNHRYAWHAAQEALTAEGFVLVEEDQRSDGTLHLVMRRAV